jgi:tetratricopeptide (TPR) repeat protein
MNERQITDIKVNRKTALILVAILILLLSAAGIYHYFKGNKISPQSTPTNGTGSQDNQNATAANGTGDINQYKSPSEIALEQNHQYDQATNYFDKGLTNFNAMQFQAAIDNFTQAIKINPGDDAYYSKKAQAEMNLGNKQAAIDTLSAGLTAIPNSDLLKNQIDTLQNSDQLGNQDGIK